MKNNERLGTALIQIIGAIGVAVGLFLVFASDADFTQVKPVLGSGLVVLLCGVFLERARQRQIERRQGIPCEDELTRRIRQRAAATAFSHSLILWMAIFVTHDVFDKPETMLGVGILGQAGLYGLHVLRIRKAGIRFADAD